MEDTVRDFWATRPQRRATDRKIAGVAAAIGRRYAIDPVLVRVAFVVATIVGGGIGVLLYLAGWLLLPVEGDRVSPAESVLGRGHSSASVILTVCLGLLLISATFGVLGGHPEGLVWLALAGGGLYLLHRHRAGAGQRPAVAHPGEATEPLDPAPGDTRQRTPPEWDPLGTAPFAWDLPEPGPTPEQGARARRPGPVTAVTLGLALVAGGIGAAFLPALGVSRVAALMLGVVGIGLVVGSVRHAGRGLIVAAVPLAAVTVVSAAAPTTDADQVLGQGRWSAAAPRDLQASYELVLGSGRLDLRGLRVPPGRSARTALSTGIGESTVVLPPRLDVRLTCLAGLGAVNCLGTRRSGTPPPVTLTDYGIDGPGGGRLVLDVRAGVGNVEVTRG